MTSEEDLSFTGNNLLGQWLEMVRGELVNSSE